MIVLLFKKKYSNYALGSRAQELDVEQDDGGSHLVVVPKYEKVQRKEGTWDLQLENRQRA